MLCNTFKDIHTFGRAGVDCVGLCVVVVVVGGGVAAGRGRGVGSGVAVDVMQQLSSPGQ